jgi:hypothetical protein
MGMSFKGKPSFTHSNKPLGGGGEEHRTVINTAGDTKH